MDSELLWAVKYVCSELSWPVDSGILQSYAPAVAFALSMGGVIHSEDLLIKECNRSKVQPARQRHARKHNKNWQTIWPCGWLQSFLSILSQLFLDSILHCVSSP